MLLIKTIILTDSLTPQGVLRILYTGVCVEGKIQTQKHGFHENFAPKNIGILHISYPQIWVKIVLVIRLMVRDYF